MSFFKEIVTACIFFLFYHHLKHKVKMTNNQSCL